MERNYSNQKWTRNNFLPHLPLGKDGTYITGSKEHTELARRAACEGTVLLKNENNLLPLKRGQKVAVFGKAQYEYIKGGTGSGDVFCKYITNVYEGLLVKHQEGKIFLFDKLYPFYEKEMQKQYDANKSKAWTKEPAIPEDLLRKARAYTDTAIITISRSSGEGYDRFSQPHGGDFYLDEAEEAMVDTVVNSFKNVIVVLNLGAQLDTEWFHGNDKIGAVVHAWQGGMEGGLALADILVGDENPSGKLVDTFARGIPDYPSTDSFSESENFVKYYEDIYVGYRYFETIPGADKLVNYPFGFGLSYTEFVIDNLRAFEHNGKVKVAADVMNVGEMAGKEVVQVYYSAPQGILGKPKYALCAFKKTKLLEPGEKITVFMSFDINDMASYDDTGKIRKSAYLLETGDYKFYVGNHIRNTVELPYHYTVAETRVIRQLTEHCAPKELNKRMLADGSFEELKPVEKEVIIPDVPAVDAKAPEKRAMLIDVAEGSVTMDEFMAQLSDDELVSLTYGKENRKIVTDTGGMGGAIGNQWGIPLVMCCDGPAGVRLVEETGVSTTAFPVATMLACTWNPELLFEVGMAGAKEVRENALGIWLTPALNIHRNPLCGRNFEYYSEDPLISGKMAAAMVKGIQSQHVSACVKHFCANNKETNRKDSDSIVSERALREIYLKGFEIVVNEADPWVVMSSYNILNGTRTSENYELLTSILREEWGFDGLVASDWLNHSTQYVEIKAGNDVRMPFECNQHEDVIKALHEGKISRAQIWQAGKRLLNWLLKID